LLPFSFDANRFFFFFTFLFCLFFYFFFFYSWAAGLDRLLFLVNQDNVKKDKTDVLIGFPRGNEVSGDESGPDNDQRDTKYAYGLWLASHLRRSGLTVVITAFADLQAKKIAARMEQGGVRVGIFIDDNDVAGRTFKAKDLSQRKQAVVPVEHYGMSLQGESWIKWVLKHVDETGETL
jgi:histidyl-tRNA synthetase